MSYQDILGRLQAIAPVVLYSVVTCLPCGYREAVRPGCAYPPRCPNDGGPLEHKDCELNEREARELGSRGRDPRRPRETLRQVR